MAKSKYGDEAKLKAMGLISQNIPIREITERLEIGYGTVLTWKKEYEKNLKAASMESLVKVDGLVVERIAKEFQEELTDIGPAAIEGELMELTKGIDGYKALSVELQSTASSIAKQIDILVKAGAGPSELSMLTESLASLQNAFFSKNVTNVNVLNAGNGGGTFSGFKNRD